MSEAEEAFVRCCGTQRLSPRYYTANGESEDEGSYANYDDSDTEQNMQYAMEGITSSEDESDGVSFANRPNVGTTIQDEDEKMDDYSSENDGEKEDENVKDQGERISDIHMTQNYIGGERQNFDNNPQLPPIQLSPPSPSTSSISAATISSSPSPTHLSNATFRLYTPQNSNRDTLSTREPISLPPISNSHYISDNYSQNQSSGSMLRYPPISTNHLSYPPVVPNSSFSSSSQTPQPVEPPKQSPLRYGFPDTQDDDEEAGSLPGASRKRVRTKSNDWAQIGNNNLNNNGNGTQQGYQPAHGTPSPIGRDQNSGCSSSSSTSNNSSNNTIAFSNRSSRPMQPIIQLGINSPSSINRYANITPDSSPITNFNTNYPRGPDFIQTFSPLGSQPQLTTMPPPPTNPISSSSSSSPTSTFSSPFMPLPRLSHRVPLDYRRQHVSNQVDSSPRRSSNHNGSDNNNSNNSDEQQSHNRNFTSENEDTRREFVYSQDAVQRVRLPTSHRWNPRGGSEWTRPPTIRRLGRSNNNNNTNNHSTYMNSLHESAMQGFLSDEEREPIEVPDSPQRELNNQSTNSNRDSQWSRRMTLEMRQQEFERERPSVNYIRPHALPQAVTGTTAEGTTVSAPRHHHYHHHHHHNSNERAMTDAELARRMQAQEYSAIQSQNVRENVNSLARIMSENGSIPRPSVSRHTSRRDTGSNSSSSARSNSTSRERLRFQSRLAELFDYHRHSDERSSERNRVGLRGSQSRPPRPHHHHFINHPLLSNFMEEIELEDLLEMLPDVIGNGIMSNPDNYLDDDEFDPSYENLIRLCEQNGDVKPKCAPETAVKNLPIKAYTAPDVKEKSVEKSEERCTICLTEYEINDQLRVLPCSHEFHQECIDKWLSIHSDQCAICRRSITEK